MSEQLDPEADAVAELNALRGENERLRSKLAERNDTGKTFAEHREAWGVERKEFLSKLKTLRERVRHGVVQLSAAEAERDAARAELARRDDKSWDDAHELVVAITKRENEACAVIADLEAGEDVGDWVNQNAAHGRHVAAKAIAAAIRARAK